VVNRGYWISGYGGTPVYCFIYIHTRARTHTDTHTHTHVLWSSRKVFGIFVLSWPNLDLINRFSRKSPIPNFTKNRRLAAELIHADRRKDGQHEANSFFSRLTPTRQIIQTHLPDLISRQYDVTSNLWNVRLIKSARKRSITKLFKIYRIIW
jgi:hypothetical protein